MDMELVSAEAVARHIQRIKDKNRKKKKKVLLKDGHGITYKKPHDFDISLDSDKRTKQKAKAAEAAKLKIREKNEQALVTTGDLKSLMAVVSLSPRANEQHDLPRKGEEEGKTEVKSSKEVKVAAAPPQILVDAALKVKQRSEREVALLTGRSNWTEGSYTERSQTGRSEITARTDFETGRTNYTDRTEYTDRSNRNHTDRSDRSDYSDRTFTERNDLETYRSEVTDRDGYGTGRTDNSNTHPSSRVRGGIRHSPKILGFSKPKNHFEADTERTAPTPHGGWLGGDADELSARFPVKANSEAAVIRELNKLEHCSDTPRQEVSSGGTSRSTTSNMPESARDRARNYGESVRAEHKIQQQHAKKPPKASSKGRSTPRATPRATPRTQELPPRSDRTAASDIALTGRSFTPRSQFTDRTPRRDYDDRTDRSRWTEKTKYHPPSRTPRPATARQTRTDRQPRVEGSNDEEEHIGGWTQRSVAQTNRTERSERRRSGRPETPVPPLDLIQAGLVLPPPPPSDRSERSEVWVDRTGRTDRTDGSVFTERTDRTACPVAAAAPEPYVKDGGNDQQQSGNRIVKAFVWENARQQDRMDTEKLESDRVSSLRNKISSRLTEAADKQASDDRKANSAAEMRREAITQRLRAEKERQQAVEEKEAARLELRRKLAEERESNRSDSFASVLGDSQLTPRETPQQQPRLPNSPALAHAGFTFHNGYAVPVGGMVTARAAVGGGISGRSSSKTAKNGKKGAKKQFAW